MVLYKTTRIPLHVENDNDNPSAVAVTVNIQHFKIANNYRPFVIFFLLLHSWYSLACTFSYIINTTPSSLVRANIRESIIMYFKVAFVSALCSVAVGQSTCPTVWTDVATDLKALFVDSAGAATDDARAAIRLTFHDCFPSACDGSIILANECSDRGENTQMVGICTTLGDMATQYNVSTADIIQLGAGEFNLAVDELYTNAMPWN